MIYREGPTPVLSKLAHLPLPTRCSRQYQLLWLSNHKDLPHARVPCTCFSFCQQQCPSLIMSVCCPPRLSFLVVNCCAMNHPQTSGLITTITGSPHLPALGLTGLREAALGQGLSHGCWGWGWGHLEGFRPHTPGRWCCHRPRLPHNMARSQIKPPKRETSRHFLTFSK